MQQQSRAAASALLDKLACCGRMIATHQLVHAESSSEHRLASRVPVTAWDGCDADIVLSQAMQVMQIWPCRPHTGRILGLYFAVQILAFTCDMMQRWLRQSGQCHGGGFTMADLASKQPGWGCLSGQIMPLMQNCASSGKLPKSPPYAQYSTVLPA